MLELSGLNSVVLQDHFQAECCNGQGFFTISAPFPLPTKKLVLLASAATQDLRVS